VRSWFGEPFDGYTFRIETLGVPLEALVPNYYRSHPADYDSSRMPRPGAPREAPVVENVSKPRRPTAGLFNRNIGLWHSHGWYYNNSFDRWEWQRPRLFQSVEDLGPMSFVLPYLVPMLENAGAAVFLPRERDMQVNEVIVDNDSPGSGYREAGAAVWTADSTVGFGAGTPPYAGNLNPFKQGTARFTRSARTPTATASWTPEIPEEGDYFVSVTYSSSAGCAPDARYTVYHTGGKTEFRVNQRVGGSTWQYLGRFRFRKGKRPDEGRVMLSNMSEVPGTLVSADAARFGGGVGVIARSGVPSGRPKYLEGARYWLQFAGMPDTLVYSLNADTSDYKDDYQSRAEYVNYLSGTPRGPNTNRTVAGLGIPMDVSLAFHTDAGITRNDTSVGTLLIYSLEGKDSARVFPDSMSRLANRDFADILQTQLTEDLRVLFDPSWNRRQLRNADYSEATRPNVPGVLLELLSHQNFLDMQFMLDPRFRFSAARAIYKAITRFISFQNGERPVIQPLQPTHLAALLDSAGAVTVRWRAQADPLETSAVPDAYIIYTRQEDGGFDNGVLVEDTIAVFPAPPAGRLMSYRVTARNAGGESFPSETVAVCRSASRRPPALIINGFTRVSAPAVVESPVFSGFFDRLDAGVPDGVQVNLTGEQYDYNPESPFRTNDSPGHGASFADREGTLVAGNTFDFVAVHGRALRDAGLPFCSSSRDAVAEGLVSLTGVPFVDLILGEQKATRWHRRQLDSLRGIPFRAFPRVFQELISAYCGAGGTLFVSGAYPGTDLFASPGADSTDVRFALEVLKINLATDHASRTGFVRPARASFFPDTLRIRFTTELSPDVYQVEAPDAVVPAGGSTTVLRYAENQFSAATAYRGTGGVVVFGFPFETIADAWTRRDVMRSILEFFGL
jgi:hypothetical protein